MEGLFGKMSINPPPVERYVRNFAETWQIGPFTYPINSMSVCRQILKLFKKVLGGLLFICAVCIYSLYVLYSLYSFIKSIQFYPQSVEY